MHSRDVRADIAVDALAMSALSPRRAEPSQQRRPLQLTNNSRSFLHAFREGNQALNQRSHLTGDRVTRADSRTRIFVTRLLQRGRHRTCDLDAFFSFVSL
jgi:hypothetical protein